MHSSLPAASTKTLVAAVAVPSIATLHGGSGSEAMRGVQSLHCTSHSGLILFNSE